MRPAVIAAAVAAELVLAIGALPAKLSNEAGPGPATADATAASPVGAIVSPRGVVLAVLGREGDRWRVRTPCGGEAVVTSGRPLTSATVVLDPGHGGEDSGALGPNGLTEADLNLAVARQAKAALERSAVSVVLTRDGSYDMTLEARADLALALHPRVVVSVHHNSVGVVPSARPGTEVYYQAKSADSKRLAGLVYEDVSGRLASLGGPWVSAKAGAKYMLATDGDDYLGILRRTHGVTAALAEMAYLTHPPEAQLLARPETQRLEGEALAAAILRFLRSNDPGSGFVDPNPPPGKRAGGLVCRDPAL